MIYQPEENKTPPKSSLSGNAGGKKRIRFFTSFQQQEDELVDYWASILPLYRGCATFMK